jgi:hypothetical protein
MLKRAVFIIALAGSLLVSTQSGTVRAAAGSPLEGAWQVTDVGGQK